MTLDQAKAYLRIESGGEDALIGALLASAIGVCEAFIGSALVRRDVAETLAADGRWQRLRVAPVEAIVAVEQVDPSGTASALSPPSYAVDIDGAGEGWVRAPGMRVRVRYVAGLSPDAAGVPAAIAQGVIRLVAHLYASRDDAKAPPAAVAALWRPFRRVRLARERRA